MKDSNVAAVVHKMQKREEMGISKYQVTTDRDETTDAEWLRHAQEEAMDLCVYLERIMKEQSLSFKEATITAFMREQGDYLENASTEEIIRAFVEFADRRI